jgi:hypothetical protein
MPEHTGVNECVEAREEAAQPFVKTVDHLGEAAREHRDAPVGSVLLLSRGRGAAIRRTDRGRPWRRATVETLLLSGGGPYQDAATTSEVTFEGGTPSATKGWELAYATFPPLKWPEGEVYSIPPYEVRQREHDRRVRLQAKALLDWDQDASDGGKRQMGATYLKEWSFVRGDRWHSVYRAVVVKPNMS